MMIRAERRIFTDEFKHQMVQLYASRKPRKEIIREYSLTPSALDKWVKQCPMWSSSRRQSFPRRSCISPMINGWKMQR